MKVLITDYDFPDVDLELDLFRRAGFEVSVAKCKTEEDLIKFGHDADAFLLQYAHANAKVFSALPKLRIVSRFGAGFDTVNIADAEKYGVWVANSPDYGVNEVATHALAMALSLIRHLPFYDRDVRAGQWHYLSPGVLKRPNKMTFGVLGFGRIGKRTAHLAQNIFSQVIACDPYIPAPDFPSYVEPVDCDTLFSVADVISIHIPLNNETRNFVNMEKLTKMKPASYLVNTARGAIVDLDALTNQLNLNHLAGAALDVLPIEPPISHPIMQQPKVLLTPHSAFYSYEAEIELRHKAAQNIITFAHTGEPDYIVVKGKR